MSQIIVFLALAFSILIAIFAVQNTTAVAVQFLTFHSDSVAISVLVLMAALLGAAVMLLLSASREISLRWRHHSTVQQLHAAQKRVTELEAVQATHDATAQTGPALTTGAASPPAAETPAS
jgi:uncharacterized integral membrane protein